MLPDFIKALPALDIPVAPEIVSTHALNSEKGLGVFFVFHQDFAIPPHAHKAQWGTVLAGALTLTLGGETRTYRTGESYTIPSGAEHSASGTTGTIVFDVFEEPDRYALRD